MTNVTYTGTADFQEFSAADFKKAGVEDQNKVRFANGESTEVSESAAEALTAEDGLFGGHSFELSQEDDESNEGTKAEKKAAAKKSASSSGTIQQTDETSTSGPTSTGKGTSTQGSR
jgi:hypothetical protein